MRAVIYDFKGEYVENFLSRLAIISLILSIREALTGTYLTMCPRCRTCRQSPAR